jgi:predicted DNA-binding transcriptional regulator YafY
MSTERLLAILSQLQRGAQPTGPQLADELGVTVRTVRRDIDRLRTLGYAIDAVRGVEGRYALGTGGSAVPPLMLDREETVALAVCVRAAAGDSVVGIADAAERALGKLHSTLPPTARAEAEALAAATLRLPSGGDAVDHGVLLAVSNACRVGERLHVPYRDAQGRSTDRRIEPYRVVSVGRRWYLVAYDLDRRDWRTFRLDRMGEPARTGHGVTLPDPPDAASFVHRAITTAPYPYQAQVLIHAAITDVQRLIPPGVGMLESVAEDVTRLTAGADNLDYLVIEVATTGFDFEVESPPELRDRVAEIGRRLLAVADVSRSSD